MKKVKKLLITAVLIATLTGTADARTIHDSNSASNVFWGFCVSIGECIIKAEIYVLEKLGVKVH